MRAAICLVALACLAGACTREAGWSNVAGESELDGIEVVGDFEVSVVIDQLSGPTQFYVEPGGSFVVAQINGGERDGVGQVVRIDPDGQRTVLFDQLDKPTGVLGRGEEIWVMEATQLSKGSARGGALTPVVQDLPNNGRSQGTLTLTPEAAVLYNTSGSKRGSVVAEGSGRLWEIDDNEVPREVASGFKHAYAHAYVGDQLWSTEMSDGTFDGETPEDELVQVSEGVDHGWPFCVGQNRPVAEYGQTDCEGVPETVVAFEAGATPTGLVESPFFDGGLHVALWTRGLVVSVSNQARPGAGDSFVPLLSGLAGPQHLVAHEGDLYLSEFGANRILRIRGN